MTKILNATFHMKAKVWLYSAPESAWHFLTLPKKEADEISIAFEGMKRGWGSLPVKVTIGKTSWKTSIFPDKKSSSYVLPLKVEVRKKESIGVGNMVDFTIEIQ